jgi:hypothetical protein
MALQFNGIDVRRVDRVEGAAPFVHPAEGTGTGADATSLVA